MTVDHLEGLLHVQTNKVTTSLVCFVAQLVEECTSIAEVMGFDSRIGLHVFQALFSLLVKWCSLQ